MFPQFVRQDVEIGRGWLLNDQKAPCRPAETPVTEAKILFDPGGPQRGHEAMIRSKIRDCGLMERERCAQQRRTTVGGHGEVP